MKRAPLVALASIALFLGTMAVAPELQAPTRGGENLDFRYVDTLVLESEGHLEIQLNSSSPVGRLGDRNSPLKAVRSGSTLTLRPEEGNVSRHPFPEIVVPTTLRRIEIHGDGHVTIKARATVDSLEIRADRGVEWSGNARELRIVDEGTPKNAECRTCGGNDLAVSGEIGSLTVLTRNGNVSLKQYPRIGEVVLELGEEAEYELGGLRGPVRAPVLRKYREATPAPAPVPKVTPPGPPAEPPRTD